MDSGRTPNGKVNLYVSGVQWGSESVLPLLPLIHCPARCSVCCTVPEPIVVHEEDIERIGKVVQNNKLKKQLKQLDPGVWTMSSPCQFLWHGRCSVYEHRPAMCKYFPLQRVQREEGLVVGVCTEFCDAGHRCISKLMEWQRDGSIR